MATIMPEKDILKSIDSVAANFARSKEEEATLVHGSYNSSLAKDVLRTHGVVAYEDYVAAIQAASDTEYHGLPKRMVKMQARAKVFERRCEQLKDLAKYVSSNVVRYHS